MNDYGSLCTLMYDLDKPVAPAQELAFYSGFIAPGKRVLEPMCGTGRFLLPLAAQDVDIEGFDLSADMLHALREKAARSGQSVKVWQQNILDFAPGPVYDYIFIASGSFSLLLEDKLVDETLQRLAQALKPGGKFAFEAESTLMDVQEYTTDREDKRVTTPQGYQLIQKGICQRSKNGKQLDLPHRYELYSKDELLQSEPMDFSLRLYDPGELDSRLYNAGFSKVEVYAGFDYSRPVGAANEQMIYICTK